MFLSKSRTGYYYIWYKDERGKKCKVSTRTKVKGGAYQALANFKALIYGKTKVRSELKSDAIFADAAC